MHSHLQQFDGLYAPPATGIQTFLKKDVFAISPYVGIKSASERFAGAKETYTIELVMPDGKALQAATSHDLSDNFSKVFAIEFLNDANEKVNPYQTSWGLSTRSIGGLILVHGDDAGLVLPPKAAPIQVVLVPFGDKDEENQKKIIDYAQLIHEELLQQGILSEVDTRTYLSFGNRANEWELKGIPLRLEIGLKEIEGNHIKYARRDNFEKDFIARDGVSVSVQELLNKIQDELLAKSKQVKVTFTKEANDFDEYKKILTNDRSLVRAFWCEEASCEKDIKEATKSTTRCLEMENIEMNESASCFHCKKPATRKWLFGQSY